MWLQITTYSYKNPNQLYNPHHPSHPHTCTSTHNNLPAVLSIYFCSSHQCNQHVTSSQRKQSHWYKHYELHPKIIDDFLVLHVNKNSFCISYQEIQYNFLLNISCLVLLQITPYSFSISDRAPSLQHISNHLEYQPGSILHYFALMQITILLEINLNECLTPSNTLITTKPGKGKLTMNGAVCL